MSIAYTNTLPTYANSAFSQHILAAANADEYARRDRIAQAWEAYRGIYSPSVKVPKGQQYDPNVTMNRMRIIADIGVRFLFGKEVNIGLSSTDTPVEATQTEAGDAESAQVEDAEAWLEQVWKRNKMQSTLQQWGQTGAVAGHAFLRITGTRDAPRVTVLDPASVSVTWNPHDITDVLRYTITTSAVTAKNQAINYRQTVERIGDGPQWTIRDEESDPNSLSWRKVSEETWPWPWCPIVDCQNIQVANEYWGDPDITESLLALQKSLNFALTDINVIQHNHAYPIVYTEGYTPPQGGRIEGGPGRVMHMGAGKLGVLDPSSDLAGYHLLVEKLLRAIHEDAAVPEIALGRTQGTGPIPGVSLRIQFAPLLEKTEAKRLTYGEALETVCCRLLDMGGWQNIAVELGWPELLPSDPEGLRRIAEMDLGIGFSRKTVMESLGGDWDHEQQQCAKEMKVAQAMTQMMAPPAGGPMPGQDPGMASFKGVSVSEQSRQARA